MTLREGIEKIFDKERYHMPGHKGVLRAPLDEVAKYDATETDTTGSLFDDTEIFLDIEKKFEAYYGSGGALISAGGCTLAIQTMLSLYLKPKSKAIFARNAHRSAISSAMLIDVEVVWMYDISELPSLLLEHDDVKAVYITSPDYFGKILDIKAISQQCGEIPLLVDNAHGSHLIYFDNHPIQQGAAACADSLHKSMPVLTGGAVLHLKDKGLKQRARRLMPIFGSTSPSYPIMLSIEDCALNLDNMKDSYIKMADEVALYKKRLGEMAYSFADEPLRAVILHDAPNVNELLNEANIVPELVSENLVIFLFAPNSSLQNAYKFADLISEYPCKEMDEIINRTKIPKGERVLSIREASFADYEQLDVENCEGRISAEVVAPCPPGIPITVFGEKIGKNVIFLLKKYRITKLFVVK